MSSGKTQALLRRVAETHNRKPGTPITTVEKPAAVSTTATNATGDIIPNGVTLRDPEDFTSLRNNIYNGMHDEVKASFPQTYGGVRMELHDTGYEDPEDFDIDTQKQALMQNKTLGRRLRGTVKLFDDKTGDQLDEKRMTLMKVPYLTERGTFVNNGSEYTSMSQMRLLPGPYTRRKANGDHEAHFNVKRGTGSAFRVRFEPSSALYKMDVGQSSLRLYSLLKDIGVPDETMENAWGPEVFKTNQQSYDARVFDKAYARLVKKPNPDASREEKAAAIREAFDKMQVNTRVARKNLPNMFDSTKSAQWRQEFRKQAAAPMVSFPGTATKAAPMVSFPGTATKAAPMSPTLSKLFNEDTLAPTVTNYEGYRPLAYNDSVGVPTVGYGTNLISPGVAERVNSLGLSYRNVLAKLQQVSEPHARSLMRTDLTTAIGNARRLVPNFDTLPDPIKSVVGDMSYNMGPSRLAGFKKFIAALQGNNYSGAADEMVNSKWYKQVGNRSKEHEAIMRSFARGNVKSSSILWKSAAFLKLAKGAVVMLPVGEDTYLLERNSADSKHNPGKLRPPGGGQEKNENLKETIVREIGEEFGIPEEDVEPKIELLGLDYREPFKGSGVFYLDDHGLEAGVYQASNDPEEKITLEVARLDDPDYCGPDLDKLTPAS